MLDTQPQQAKSFKTRNDKKHKGKNQNNKDNKNNNTPGGLNTSILPCHANFVLAIDPIRFGLHKSGLKWHTVFLDGS